MTAASGDADFDIVIAGGGMVGASLAVALAGQPLRIALVEALPFGAPAQPSFDARTVALSRSSFRILATLGIWPDIAGAAATIRRIHVSEQGCFGTALIDADQQGVPALGYVLDNRELGAALWTRLSAQGNCQVHAPARVTGTEPDGERLRLALAGDGCPSTLTARLLVVADGARSALRPALGIGARVQGYGQGAIVGNVAVSRPGSRDMAFERFTPEGPLALLPAGGGRYAFVLARETARLQPTLELPDAGFLALLQQAFGWRLGRLTRLGRRAAYPLELTVADRVTAPRAVLVGNAAHALHPVAAQGYNLGLRDVAALAELLADGAGGDPGAPALLARYAHWREADQRNVVAFTDGLVRLFGLAGTGLPALRGAGLQLFDLLPPAKRVLAHHTMGLSGRVTRLARGLRP
jgi:2-octaprenyl-6-methoxyphenol hydroxylase